MFVLAGLVMVGNVTAQRQRRGFDGVLSKARSFLLQRRYSDAAAEARDALRLSPDRWEGYEVLGDALRFDGDYAKAIKAFDDALAKAPVDERERLQRSRSRCSADGVIATVLEEGENASKAGHHAFAAGKFVDAAARAPNRPEIALSAAKEFVAANRTSQALTYLELASAGLGETAPFREILADVAKDSARLVDELLNRLNESMGAGVLVADLEPLVRAGLLVAPNDVRLHLWSARCARLRNDDGAFAGAIDRARAIGWVPSADDQRDALLGPGLQRLASGATSTRRASPPAAAGSSAPAPTPAPTPAAAAPSSEDLMIVGGIEVKRVAPGVLLHGPHDGRAGNSVCTITRPFFLGTSEVTRAQWKSVMGWLPREAADANDLPVTHVSWEDAWWFCRRLSATTGQSCRLPTVAEWLLACNEAKYGLRTPEAIDEHAWVEIEPSRGPMPVRGKKANPPGFYDMYGNVAEFVSDWDGDRSGIAAIDPQGPSGGQFKATLGGDWRKGSGDLHLAVPPRQVRASVGLRIAVDVLNAAVNDPAQSGARSAAYAAKAQWNPGRSAVDLVEEEDRQRQRTRRVIRVSPELVAGRAAPEPVLLVFIDEGALVVGFDKVPALADTGGGSDLAMINARAWEETEVKIERVAKGDRWICRDRSFPDLFGEIAYELTVELTAVGGAKVSATYDLLGLNALRAELERPWETVKKTVLRGIGAIRPSRVGAYGFDCPGNGESYRDDKARDANTEKQLTQLFEQMGKMLASDTTWRLELRVQGSLGPGTKQSHAFRGAELVALVRKGLRAARFPEARVDIVPMPDRAPVRRTDVSVDEADHIRFTFFVARG